MNKELMKSIITDKISDKISQMIEEMSTNEFVDMVIDTYYKETGIDLGEDDEANEVVSEMIGDKVFPLLTTIQQYILENIVKK